MGKKILVNLTDQQVKDLDQIVSQGIYHNRTEAIRDAIRRLIRGN